MSSRDWHLRRTVLADPVGGGEQVPITSGLIETPDGTKAAAFCIGAGPAVYIDLVNGCIASANIKLTLGDRYYGAGSPDFGRGSIG